MMQQPVACDYVGVAQFDPIHYTRRLMPNQLQFNIPSITGDPITFSLGAGDVLYLLDANGTGKSSLVSRLFMQHQDTAMHVSTHHQTWLDSNTLDMTPPN